MAVDREARAQFAQALRLFSDGHITNRDLVNAIDTIPSQDSAVLELGRVLDFMFDDCCSVFTISLKPYRVPAERPLPERIVSFMYEERFRMPWSSRVTCEDVAAARTFLERCARFLDSDYEYVKPTKTARQRLRECLAGIARLVTLGFCGGAAGSDASDETWPFSETQTDPGRSLSP